MQRTWSQGRLALALSIASTGMIALGGCQRAESPAPAAAEPPPPPSAVATPAYTPPTADQLYQLVAPIALFPDKLLAQTLAASVYPDQVVTAQEWLRSNSGLSAADRAGHGVAILGSEHQGPDRVSGCRVPVGRQSRLDACARRRLCPRPQRCAQCRADHAPTRPGQRPPAQHAATAGAGRTPCGGDAHSG